MIKKIKNYTEIRFVDLLTWVTAMPFCHCQCVQGSLKVGRLHKGKKTM